MITCVMCGQPVKSRPVYIDGTRQSIVIDDRHIRLPHSEFIITEMLVAAMGRGPVHIDQLINAVYLLDEPKDPAGTIRRFLFTLRLRIQGTKARIESFWPNRYGLIYGHSEAA